ncbi:hypothetical protein GGX14DRAFT_553476 [Mycena pura]|uniref:Uncharacterized protein n=1 Tax=Mycena pura TaxID=153505 RepID=A0AAD6YUE6_9AGAR|nr:hypothetical protein GGX14DRAFT_553476 [Mycena pura]
MAAPNFTVVEITRDPQHSAVAHIKDGYGLLNGAMMMVLENEVPVFSNTDPVPAVATQGHIPTAFTIDTNDIIPITVHFRCQNFPNGTQRYYLVGSGPGIGNLSIRSADFAIPGGVPGPNAAALEATQFTYPNPLPVNSPFRVTGDWTWTIHRTNDNALVATAGNPTRLELYFFLSDTTSNGDHLLDFLRLAVPEYPVIANQQWSAVQQVVIGQIVVSLWGLGGLRNAPGQQFIQCGRVYDNRRDAGGAAHHLTGAGGQFEFNVQSFMEVNQNMILVNCEDLAALVLVAFRALGQRVVGGVSQDVLPGALESRTMWGYIPDGPLWGWPQQSTCNSPFWKDVNFNDAYNSHENNRTAPDRSHFHSHTYVVYRDLNNNEVVTDICHGLLQGGNNAILTNGVSRAQYYQQAIDFSLGTYTINSLIT